jgi:hypothetical protein
MRVIIAVVANVRRVDLLSTIAMNNGDIFDTAVIWCSRIALSLISNIDLSGSSVSGMSNSLNLAAVMTAVIL